MLISTLGFTLLITIQAVIEVVTPDYALYSAVFIMTFLQFILLLNVILSTVAIFTSSLISWMMKALPRDSFMVPPKPLNQRHLRSKKFVVYLGNGAFRCRC